MCLCQQAVLFGTGLRALMPYGWEGNRAMSESIHAVAAFRWVYDYHLWADCSSGPLLDLRPWDFTLILPLFSRILLEPHGPTGRR